MTCWTARSSAPARPAVPWCGMRFVERTAGTGLGRGRLLYADLSTFEPPRLGVGATVRGAARSDEAGGREVERRAGRTAAHAGRRTRPHAGGGGKSGTAARAEAGYRSSAAE